MVKNQNWKKDETHDQIKISKIPELSWLSEERNTVQFKYEFAESPRILSLKKIRRSQLQTCSIQLPQLYISPLPIDCKNLQGLLQLCRGDRLPQYGAYKEKTLSKEEIAKKSLNRQRGDWKKLKMILFCWRSTKKRND
ncbi:unnamed protein product [Acanthoscelides obtectus]|uniref:Uncharacterized protein n=1 Tax=Acanthoscelides obtectus TaxID=200917 RepID=A0A9P0PCU1_ACAOB|nr:unnamed protein product [Acanthoscelides obtectus]CAK1670216.1 hypothetical protein AOBTE_LOCUS27483 [Acanthoscelides obtectus]